MPTRAPHTLIGVYTCWCCNHEVPVKKTDGGSLSAPCSYCDFPHYARPKTEHFKRLMAAVRPTPKPLPLAA